MHKQILIKINLIILSNGNQKNKDNNLCLMMF